MIFNKNAQTVEMSFTEFTQFSKNNPSEMLQTLANNEDKPEVATVTKTEVTQKTPAEKPVEEKKKRRLYKSKFATDENLFSYYEVTKDSVYRIQVYISDLLRAMGHSDIAEYLEEHKNFKNRRHEIGTFRDTTAAAAKRKASSKERSFLKSFINDRVKKGR